MEYDKNRKIYFHYGMEENESVIKATDVCQVYDKFIDNESRQIFADRLLFSLTDDWSFIRNLLIETGNYQDFHRDINKKKDVPVYIYGAGISGSRLPLIWPSYPWSGYIDKGKKGKTCNGLPIFGIDKCREFLNNEVIVISNIVGGEKIKKNLLEEGVLEENIILYKEYIDKVAQNMYFDNECIDKERIKGKAFVDAGAFDGTDTVHFFNWMNDINIDVVVFEADKDNFEITKRNLKIYPKVSLYNQGLSDISGQQLFLSGKGEMSSFSDKGNSIIYMNSLDRVASNIRVGYIKMDIEGFEKQALTGAKETISEQKPALAISVYHKREDIWEIPKLILDINPQYRFFLRHYSLGVVDTVLYAV